jgi:hypothetical protein
MLLLIPSNLTAIKAKGNLPRQHMQRKMNPKTIYSGQNFSASRVMGHRNPRKK